MFQLQLPCHSSVRRSATRAVHSHFPGGEHTTATQAFQFSLGISAARACWSSLKVEAKLEGSPRRGRERRSRVSRKAQVRSALQERCRRDPRVPKVVQGDPDGGSTRREDKERNRPSRSQAKVTLSKAGRSRERSRLRSGS